MTDSRDYLIVTADETLRARVVQAVYTVDPDGVPTHAYAYDPAGYTCFGAAIIDAMLPRLLGDGGRAQFQPYGIDLMLGLCTRDAPVLLVLPEGPEGGAADQNDWIVRIAARVSVETITRPINDAVLIAAIRVLQRRAAYAGTRKEEAHEA